MKNAFEYEAELAALREELAEYRNLNDSLMARNLELTSAEQRNADLVELLNRVVQLWAAHDTTLQLANSICKLAPVIRDAIKPTESGAAQ